MPGPLQLPEGYWERPLTVDDTVATADLIAAQERADLGVVMVEVADIVADWQRPGYEVPAHTVGVVHDGELVALAEVGWLADRAEVAVHPHHRGLGIGTELARWVREKAAELGATVVGQPVLQGSPGDRLLEALGYRVRWTSWWLELPAGAAVPERPLPEGYVAREAREEEWEEVWTLNEDAFLEWSDRGRDTFEEWKAHTTLRPGYRPWHLRVITDPAGVVVAMALVQTNGDHAFVARLATHPDHRGRGLAQALLVDAFRVGREHGATTFELSTDSRTGALGLYEKVGMRTTSTWVNRAVELGAGSPS